MRNTDPWQISPEDFPWEGTPVERLKFLVGFAILAPSLHNTQPWVFSLGEDAIRVFVDTTRWLRTVDEDQRDLHVSVGCALENLLVAASHFGYRYEVDYFPSPHNSTLVATVRLVAGDSGLSPREDPLFAAIRSRSTDHRDFSPEPVPFHLIQTLKGCCTEQGIVLLTSTDRNLLREVDALLLHADALHFADPAYREVLAYGLKQNVFDTHWLLSKLSQLAASHLRHTNSQVKPEFQILKDSPLLGILVTEQDDPLIWIKVGQVFERIFLTAVSLGLRVEPMTHVLQLPTTKSALAALPLMQGRIPQILFRLGLEEATSAHTLRRPLEEVLLQN